MESRRRKPLGLPAAMCLLCLATTTCVSPVLAINMALVAGANQATLEITETRLNIYSQVVQQVAIDTAKGIGLGVITTVPPLPFSNNGTSQVVKLAVATLELNGFTFHEFVLPPGVQVATTEPTIILIYQMYERLNQPVTPPEGYSLVSPLVSLTAFPISSLSNPGTQQLAITPPAGTPITVTFATNTTVAASTICTSFNSSGSIVPVPTVQGPSSTTCQSTSIGTFTVLQLPLGPAPPPGTVPVPAPGGSPPASPNAGAPLPAAPALPPAPGPSANVPPPSGSSSDLALALGLGLGLGIPLLLLAAFGLWYAFRAVKRNALENMEKESDKRASLETAIVGGSRAPAAGALRTRPYLEAEELSTDRI